MSDNRTERTVRAFNYISGVIKHHAEEPFCAECKSYAAVVDMVRESLEHFQEKGNAGDIPEGFKTVFEEAKGIIKSAKVSADPIPRRKTGDCVLPDKRCFLKHSREFFRECIEHS
ncbi:MAG: hypothetical protein KAR83_00445 [Thermodesulfovibrionales bacterium]|nr:hypothetical protein [Thermodesulfovibrionales bacterium]